MRKGVETRLDGSTLVVRIPMRFQRRGGRKRIVAPDGSESCRPVARAADRGAGFMPTGRATTWSNGH